MSDDNLSGKDSLGEAANRYVTFQIVSAVIGGIIVLVLIFTVFLPMFNRVSQAVPPSSFPGPGGVGTETVTVNGRPATPAEKEMIDRQINKPPSPQPAPGAPGAHK